ncbi:lebocin-3 [Manduca sexta]|uniref:lebocin-3 n=1 Tax=Manduca sexta TaxID=7130 RepID=UPI00188FA069|nr:lebocin-3 [Manduca sexta]
MMKSVLVLCVVAVLHTAASSGWNKNNGGIILPTFRPPPIWPGITRTVREAGDQPLWLYQGDNHPRAPSSGDHPVLPLIIDDVKLDPNRRYVRSVNEPSSQEHHERFVRSFDSRSSRHHGGSHSTSSGSRDTGATHPGYNRRNS